MSCKFQRQKKFTNVRRPKRSNVSEADCAIVRVCTVSWVLKKLWTDWTKEAINFEDDLDSDPKFIFTGACCYHRVLLTFAWWRFRGGMDSPSAFIRRFLNLLKGKTGHPDNIAFSGWRWLISSKRDVMQDVRTKDLLICQRKFASQNSSCQERDKQHLTLPYRHQQPCLQSLSPKPCCFVVSFRQHYWSLVMLSHRIPQKKHRMLINSIVNMQNGSYIQIALLSSLSSPRKIGRAENPDTNKQNAVRCHQLVNSVKHTSRFWFWLISSIIWKHHVIHKTGST